MGNLVYLRGFVGFYLWLELELSFRVFVFRFFIDWEVVFFFFRGRAGFVFCWREEGEVVFGIVVFFRLVRYFV